MAELTEREAQMLAFERQWWRHPGAKEAAVRETFGVSMVRYLQQLHALIERPEALAADPVTVKRLTRARAARRAARAGQP